jgi:hypothetical protein
LFLCANSGSTPLSQEYGKLLYAALEEGKKGDTYYSISEIKKKELLDFRIKYKIASEVHFGLLKRYGWSLEEYEVSLFFFLWCSLLSDISLVIVGPKNTSRCLICVFLYYLFPFLILLYAFICTLVTEKLICIY